MKVDFKTVSSSFKNGFKDGLKKGLVSSITETPLKALEFGVTKKVYSIHPVKGMENIYHPCEHCPHFPRDGNTSECNCTMNGNRAIVKYTWESFPLEKKLSLLRKWGYEREEQMKIIDAMGVIGWMLLEFPNETHGLLKIAKYSDKNVRIFLRSLGY